MKKAIGLDIGEKRVGVAVSDMLGMLAHPLKTINWKNFDQFIEELNTIIQETAAEIIVVGVPYTLKGQHSKKTEEILKLIERLREHIALPVETIDERLTTKMAENALHAVGKKPSKLRKTIDQIAAVFILQSYLDRT